MRRRDKRIEIYFNDEELNKLDIDRENLGLSRSEYIRSLILKNVVNKKSNQELLNSIIELQKVNSNLEKLNLKKDEYEESFTNAMINASLKDLEKIINKINNKLE